MNQFAYAVIHEAGTFFSMGPRDRCSGTTERNTPCGCPKYTLSTTSNKHKGDVMERREHSPLPWRVIVDDTGDPETGGYPAICGPERFDEMIIHWKGFHHEFWDYHPNRPTQVANAALIVKAVNQHAILVEQRDALAAALLRLTNYVESFPGDVPDDQELIGLVIEARSALAAVEQGEGRK